CARTHYDSPMDYW
nr:immunoglobulin heavy chain junction region [Mus musculus]